MVSRPRLPVLIAVTLLLTVVMVATSGCVSKAERDKRALVGTWESPQEWRQSAGTLSLYKDGSASKTGESDSDSFRGSWALGSMEDKPAVILSWERPGFTNADERFFYSVSGDTLTLTAAGDPKLRDWYRSGSKTAIDAAAKAKAELEAKRTCFDRIGTVKQAYGDYATRFWNHRAWGIPDQIDNAGLAAFQEKANTYAALVSSLEAASKEVQSPATSQAAANVPPPPGHPGIQAAPAQTSKVPYLANGTYDCPSGGTISVKYSPLSLDSNGDVSGVFVVFSCSVHGDE